MHPAGAEDLPALLTGLCRNEGAVTAGLAHIATVPVSGIDPCQVVVAIRRDEQDPLVSDFVEAAQASLRR